MQAPWGGGISEFAVKRGLASPFYVEPSAAAGKPPQTILRETYISASFLRRA